MSPAISDPFTFYAPLEGEIIPPEIRRENQRIYRESQRASLFSVLTQLSLEDIEQMIQECLSSAFGQGTFILDEENLSDIVEKTIREGLADYLGETLAGQNLDFTEAFLEKMREGITRDISDKMIADCRKKGMSEADCRKQNIPPHFLSNKLVEVLTEDLRERLPEEIQRILKTKLRDVIFDRDLNQILGSEIIDLLPAVLQKGLKQSLEEQVPFLRENLVKRMTEVLPFFVSSYLQTVDAFLMENLKDLKKRADNKTAELVADLGTQLSMPAIEQIEKWKKNNPDYAPEYLPREKCFVTEGRYFQVTNEKTGEGKCLHPTPEEINTEWDKISEGIDHPSFKTEENKDDFCHYAGYCWDRTAEKGKECGECYGEWIDWGSIKPTRENISKWTREFLAGTVNFAEQLLVALTQTSVYTLTRYAQVWVEDEILTPLQPYLKQLSDFQKKLHQFLSSTIKDLLPKQIAGYLESNIDQILADICKKAERGQTIKLYQGMDEIEIGSDVGKYACEIEKRLHSEPFEYLPEEVKKPLENKIEEFIPDDIRDKYLNKSPAELLWPEITNIKDLIIGTPKQVICGELNIQKRGESNQTIKDACNKVRTKEIGGLFPYPDTLKTEWSLISESEKAFCYFRWYACENPLSGWNRPIGTIIKNLLNTECNRVDRKVAEECNGVGCYGGCKKQDLPNNLNFQCESCKISVNNSIAFTLFKYGIEKHYNLIEPTDQRTSGEKQEEIESYQWLTVAFPNQDIRKDTDRLIKERELYNDWTRDWGERNPEKSDISPKEEAEGISRLNDLSLQQQKGEDFAKAFVAWIAQNTTLYDVLTWPSFGIMRYLKGENYRGRNFLAQTPYGLLHDGVCGKVIKDFREDFPDWTFENIMAREFAEARGPRYSMESLERPTTAKALEILLDAPGEEVPSERKEQYISCLLLDFNPAQIFGLDQNLVYYVHPKEYQILFALIRDKLKPEERPEALNDLLRYLYGDTPVTLLRKIGMNLEQSQVQTFEGIISLVINKEDKEELESKALQAGAEAIYFYQHGTEDNLDADVYTKPVDLERVKEALETQGFEIESFQEQNMGENMIAFADFLATPIGNQINQGPMSEEIIRLIFRAIDPECGTGPEGKIIHGEACLNQRLGWEEWQRIQDILAKTPAQLIEELLPQKLISDKIAISPSLMDYLALTTPLGERYVDTLGKALHLTDTVANIFIAKENLDARINAATVNMEARIRDASNQVLLEWPKQGIAILGKALGKLIGVELGGKTADEMAGVCRPATNVEQVNGKCSSPEEVYKIESKECCSLGEGLVCVPRCRGKGTEECKMEIGERKEDEKCCFYDGCRICREATQREEKDKKCYRDENKEDYREIDDLKLCCRKRIEKENKCCVSIMQCIVDKFTFHLELLGDVLVDGPPLNRLTDY